MLQRGRIAESLKRQQVAYAYDDSWLLTVSTKSHGDKGKTTFCMRLTK